MKHSDTAFKIVKEFRDSLARLQVKIELAIGDALARDSEEYFAQAAQRASNIIEDLGDSHHYLHVRDHVVEAIKAAPSPAGYSEDSPFSVNRAELARLAERWEAVSKYTSDRGYKTALISCAGELRRTAEAAAPASTPDTHFAIKAMCFRCRESYPCRWNKKDYIPNFGEVNAGDWTHPDTAELDCRHCDAAEIHEALFAAALATPSPQAPPYHCTYCDGNHLEEVCPQRCVSDLANDLGRAARELHEQMACLGRCPDRADYAAAFKPILPAATQEPAGSGAQVVADLQVALRIVGDWKEDSRGLVHVHKDAIRKAIVAALRSAGKFGSPRKVGEDGAKVGDEVWVRGNLLRVDKGYLLVGVCDGGDSFDLLCRPLDVRPSSVPVGEQK